MFGRVIMIVLVGLVLWAVFARSSGASGPDGQYVVRADDTLWSIAAARYADPRQGVWELRERNGLEETLIVPGQVLIVP